MDKTKLQLTMRKRHLTDIDGMDVPSGFAENAVRLRKEAGYTQDEVAYMIGVSRATYVRIESAVHANVGIEPAVKLAGLYGVPVMELLGLGSPNVDAFKRFCACSERTQRLLRAIMEQDIASQEKLPYDPSEAVTEVYLSEEICDGAIMERFLTRTDNLSQYRNKVWYPEADVLLLINSNYYHPLYHLGDRLVVCTRPPKHNEIGIFIRDGRIYIRKYISTKDACYLERPDDASRREVLPIRVDRHSREDMNRYIKFGTVVAVI